VVFQYETDVINTVDFEQCQHEQCPELHLEYIRMILPTSLAETVNQAIHDQLVSQLTMKGQEVESLEQAAQVYLNNSQTAYPEDSIMSETHQLQWVVTVSYQSNEIVSLRSDFYEFAGGAHGFEGLLYKNFNVATAKEMTTLNMFKDLDGFSAFAKEEFHTQQQRLSETSPSWETLEFENDAFKLPENMGFTEEGLQLYYQAYEITAYQNEPFDFYISWQDVKPFLNF
tara:strand:- start:160 stop:843 length:684 start_codon:yes stop_codon:yes gene_type:complete